MRILCNSSSIDFPIQYCSDAHGVEDGVSWVVYIDDETGTAYTLYDDESRSEKEIIKEILSLAT